IPPCIPFLSQASRRGASSSRKSAFAMPQNIKPRFLASFFISLLYAGKFCCIMQRYDKRRQGYRNQNETEWFARCYIIKTNKYRHVTVYKRPARPCCWHTRHRRGRQGRL